MKERLLNLGIRIVLINVLVFVNLECLWADSEQTIKCSIYTPSDLDNWNEAYPMGILKCYDNRTGITWEREIDVMAAGLWRNVASLIVDETRERLYAWAPLKNGGPGWRIFDMKTLKPIEPETPLRQLEGIEPNLILAGDYLILFYHDSLYYGQAGESRVEETTYVFSADNLSLMNKRQGASGKIEDEAFVGKDHNYFYAVSSWDNRLFPCILKYSLPDLSLIDSIDTRILFPSGTDQISIKDLNNNKALIVSYPESPTKADRPCRGCFNVFNLDSRTIIGKSDCIDLKPSGLAVISDDGKWIFYQDGDGNSLSIYNSTTGGLLTTIPDIAPRSLGNRSYIVKDTIYVVDTKYSKYKVIDAVSGTVVRELPIREDNER